MGRNPNFGANKRCRRLVDRLSELPDEIICVILSFLSLREAATTSVLSSRWVNLWKHTPNPNSDRISRLPHSIIIRILSLLPLKRAATTSVLCSRWPDLWKHVPNLCFTTGLHIVRHRDMVSRGLWDAERCKYVQMVNSVIRSHKAPSLKRLDISLCVNKSATHTVAKWLEFAFSRGVEALVLDFQCPAPQNMVVLDESLRECGLCERTPILFKSLRRLRIQHVRVSGEAVKIFLLNCPLLEELIIAYSYFTSDVEICGSSLSLKHLSVWSTHGEKSLRVSAPNLTLFKFNVTHVVIPELLLESLPKLVQLELGFHAQKDQDVAHALFRFSSQLVILKLSLLFPKKFLAKEFPVMPKLRKLVVTYHGAKTHRLLPVTALLWASPRLVEFRVEFKEYRSGVAPIMQDRRNGERCRHLHLKLFELTGFFNGAVGHVELATYISDNCTGLEKIKIFLGLPTDMRHESHIKDYKQAARNYACQRLQGKLPQHVQLLICSYL